MKKTVKFLSGTALVVAIAFVSLSSFSTPDPVGDCGCPDGWTLTKADHDLTDNIVWDKNGDGRVCWKWLDEELERDANGKGNSKNHNGQIVKDNNQKPCDN